MKKFLLSMFLCCVPIAVIAGCGGGGGGGNGGPSVPTATPTPINQNILIIQLRDDQGGIVDGIVTFPGKTPQATVSGETSFTGVATGSRSVTAEVNGIETSKSFTVNNGTTTVVVVISAAVTPTVTSLPPTPTATISSG